MRKKLYIFIFFLGGVIAVFLNKGCNRQPQIKKEKPLEIALSSRFRQDSENPYASAVIALNPFYSLVYRPLFFYGEDLKLRPILIESHSWEGNTLILKLFPDARFSDGSQVTAYDIKVSLERSLRESKEPSPIFHYVVGSERFLREKLEHLSSIIIVNNQTLKIEFTEYIPDFSAYMASIVFCILNHDYQRGVKYTGPYYLEKKVEKEDEVLLFLQPNPYYRLKTGRERPLCLRFFRSEPKLREVVKNGTVDVFFEFMMQQEFEVHPSFRLHKAPMLGGFISLINLRSGKFNDYTLRYFLLNKLSNLELNRRQGWSFASPVRSILPYGFEENALMKPIEIKDITRPKLAKPLKLKSINTNTGIRPLLLPIIRDELLPYNIELELEFTSYDQWAKAKAAGDFDITFFYYLNDIPVPSMFYEVIFIPGRELYTGLVVPEALDLIRQYHFCDDRQKKLELVMQLEEITRREATLIPIFTSSAMLGYKGNFRPITFNYMLSFFVR